MSKNNNLERTTPKKLKKQIAGLLQNNQHLGLDGALLAAAVQFAEFYGIDPYVRDDLNQTIPTRDFEGKIVTDKDENPIPMVDLVRITGMWEKYAEFGIEGIRRLRDLDFDLPAFSPIRIQMMERIERILLNNQLEFFTRELAVSKDPEKIIYPGLKASEIRRFILDADEKIAAEKAASRAASVAEKIEEDPEEILAKLYAAGIPGIDEDRAMVIENENDDEDEDEDDDDDTPANEENRVRKMAITAAIMRLTSAGKLVKDDKKDKVITDDRGSRFRIAPMHFMHSFARNIPESRAREFRGALQAIMKSMKSNPAPTRSGRGGARPGAGRPIGS